MVKKSTRVLSFILSALLLVTMLPAVVMAEEVKYYKFDEQATTTQYYTGIDYDALVGPENEEKTGIFIIDKDWVFDAGEEPETVKFTFRDVEYTEKYNPARHMDRFLTMQNYISENGIKNPIIILTEGEYSERLVFVNGFTVLGPKAGMNPNMPHGDPTKEWPMSANRKMPTSTEYFGEAVFRVGGGLSGNRLICADNNSVGTQNYVVDGVVFQGNGSGVQEESNAGSGTRNWYVQNCIIENCHSEGGRGNGAGLGFDQRSHQTYYKNFYFSNCYVTKQDTLQLYSGHANIYFNGISAQNCVKPIIYNIGCIQWQGQTVDIANCHFWNPKNATRDNGSTSGIYINFNPINYSACGVGNDDVPYRVTVRNNSFYHVNTAGAPIFHGAMAGNTKVTIEENIFISEEGKAARPPFEFDYVTYKGQVTHNGIGPIGGGLYENGTASKEGYYELNNDRICIQNNTFVGKEFQTLPTIGTNLHPDTKVELLGNLYLDAMNSTEGKMIDPYVESAKVYNKWVWLDAARTKKSSNIVVEDINITCDGQPLDKTGYDITIDAGAKEYTKSISVSCNSNNSVRVYQSDSSWAKGGKLTGSGTYTLDTSARTSYYIVSIVSVDGRTELDYKITINRAPNPDAQLYAINPQANQEILDSSTDGITHDYFVGFDVKNFAFTLDTSANSEVVVQNGTRTLTPDENGVYTTQDLEVDTKTPFVIQVIDTNSGNLREYFYMNVNRAMNTKTELLGVTAPQASNIEASGNNTFVITVPSDTTKLTLSLNVAEGATATMIDPVYQLPMTARGGIYTIDPVKGGRTVYPVTIVSQDQNYSEDWYVEIVREAQTGCELISIADMEKIDNMYVAHTANKQFMISAAVSKGASYRIYTDAACTNQLAKPTVSLKEGSNTFWLRVFAEDETYSSEPVKLLINSFADRSDVEDTPVKLPMNDDGIIGVTGGVFTDQTIVVGLSPDVEKYNFRVQGYDNYEARVYTDRSENPMRAANNIDLTLDSGRTILYVTATKGSGANKKVIDYTIYIVSPKTYKYTDKQTSWAAGYVDDIANNGLGLMKGDDKGAFNGKNNLTRYEMAAMMVRVSGANAYLYAGANNPFADAIAEWALNYVKAAYRMGMINGYEVEVEDGVSIFEFRGKNNATRSEFFRVFANATLGMDVDEYYKANQAAIDAAVAALNLKDLEEIADWAKSAVYTAIYLELVEGDSNKKVNPSSNITRNEVAAVLSRYYSA